MTLSSGSIIGRHTAFAHDRLHAPLAHSTMRCLAGIAESSDSSQVCIVQSVRRLASSTCAHLIHCSRYANRAPCARWRPCMRGWPTLCLLRRYVPVVQWLTSLQNPTDGALVSSMKLHLIPSLNHHYNVFRAVLSWWSYHKSSGESDLIWLIELIDINN